MRGLVYNVILQSKETFQIFVEAARDTPPYQYITLSLITTLGRERLWGTRSMSLVWEGEGALTSSVMGEYAQCVLPSLSMPFSADA